MPKAVHHVVTRPGRKHGDLDAEIPVAEDLTTQPGNPVREKDVSYYGREHPLQAYSVDHAADREWSRSLNSETFAEWWKGHEERNEPLVDAAQVSGSLEPTEAPALGKDQTESIRLRARELGFGEVGFTRYDRRYAYETKKRWVKYPHAICLAVEQDYAKTQSIPSEEAEHTHFGTYEDLGQWCLDLADYIRSLGYRAQVHSHSDSSAPFIPMFVSAGLGQLGANGQLLSPHFGSRSRLMIVTTDAPITYDEPIDYGIGKFCDICQVCVDRCPSNALSKEKVWWRGALKTKVTHDRCRPVMANYDGCGVCIKVCPIQRYGMQPVMEHYVATGEVLGKGTDNLEGYTFPDQGYFGPGQKPTFDRQFFEFPRGSQEDWAFEQFKAKLKENGEPSQGELAEFAKDVKTALEATQSRSD